MSVRKCRKCGYEHNLEPICIECGAKIFSLNLPAVLIATSIIIGSILFTLSDQGKLLFKLHDMGTPTSATYSSYGGPSVFGEHVITNTSDAVFYKYPTITSKRLYQPNKDVLVNIKRLYSRDEFIINNRNGYWFSAEIDRRNLSGYIFLPYSKQKFSSIIRKDTYIRNEQRRIAEEKAEKKRQEQARLRKIAEERAERKRKKRELAMKKKAEQKRIKAEKKQQREKERLEKKQLAKKLDDERRARRKIENEEREQARLKKAAIDKAKYIAQQKARKIQEQESQKKRDEELKAFKLRNEKNTKDFLRRDCQKKNEWKQEQMKKTGKRYMLERC